MPGAAAKPFLAPLLPLWSCDGLHHPGSQLGPPRIKPRSGGHGCHWLEVFIRRVFGFSRFKRSAMPNGPKVSASGSLSPRGDWRAFSDGNANAWLDELRLNVPE
jgi:hypothetical protein